MSDVTLSAASRSQLLTLQNTLILLNRTNNRLSTGNAVNGATDNAVAYFSAQSLTNRANDLATRKSQVDQTISLLTATQNGLTAIQSTLTQIEGLVSQAQSASSTVAAAIGTEIDSLFNQINPLVNDATYQGQDLLTSSGFNVTVQFSSATTSTLTITSRSLLILSGGSSTSVGLFSFNLISAANAAIVGSFSQIANSVDQLSNLVQLTGYPALSGSSAFQIAQQSLQAAVAVVQQQAAQFGGNATFLQTRLAFTSSYSNTLTVGAGKLTLADINSEGANAVALQTRQQLGIQALSFSGQSDRSVLQLFR